MKHTIKVFSLGLLLVGSSACSNDWLELTPSAELPTDNAIQSYKDLRTALVGVYDGLQEDENYYGARMVYYADVRGDDMQASTSSSRSASLYLYNYTADNSPQIWKAPYAVIRRANNVIKAIEDGKVKDGSLADVNDVKGQALAVRALCHFDLVRVYGLPYTIDKDSYGVPVINKVTAFDDTPGRVTVAQVYEQIESDLNEACSLLKKGKSMGYFNYWAAKALLSRVYLYMGENQQTLDIALDVIDNSGYQLWTNTEYVDAWSKTGTSEVLFEIVNASTADWVDREAIGYLMSESGYGDLHVTHNFLDLMTADEKDVRLQLLKETSDSQSATFGDRKISFLSKYPGVGYVDVRVNNVPLLRLSEVYLNAAEAAVKLDNYAAADSCLNRIILRANPQAQPLSRVTLDQVLQERRKELIGEGHRFFDLMRNGLAVERYNTMADKGFHLTLAPEARRVDISYYRALLPIPKKECDANPVLRAQQNPGY